MFPSKTPDFCPHCGAPVCYAPEYDAYYCEACDLWLEEACDDPSCRFCAHRPERPSQAEELRETAEERWRKIQLSQQIVDQIQADHLRPACYLEFSSEPYGVLDSHFGGVPYVPRDGAIPTGEGGEQLWLCAQINFAQLTPLEGFPDQGIFQLFLSDRCLEREFCSYHCGADQKEKWRVVFHPEPDETVTLEECRAKMEAPQSNPLDRSDKRPAGGSRRSSVRWVPKRPMRIHFGPVEPDRVGHRDYHFDLWCAQELERRLPGADWDSLSPKALTARNQEDGAALSRLLDQISVRGSKLGGYTCFGAQRDIRQKEAWRPWDTLLFQLDDNVLGYLGEPDPEPTRHLTGAGTLNLFIRPEDLQNRDFSCVLGCWSLR